MSKIVTCSAEAISHAAPASLPAQPFWTPGRVVVALVVAGTVLRLAAATQLGLGNDEASNFSCSRHLDLCYFDHPPLCAWLGRLGTELFGQIGPLALRLPTTLLFAGTTWLVFTTGRRLFGPWPGAYAAVMLNLAPVFSVSTASHLLPDGPLMFFWAAGVRCLAELICQPEPRRPTALWLGVGACLGLAMLSKYSGALLVPGTLAFVCTRAGQRRWLWHPGPYLALALAAAIFAPVLVWNARHDWVSLGFQGGRGAASDGLHGGWFARSVAGQALWLLPWLWAVLAWELFSGLRCRTTDQRRWFISCLALPLIAIFTFVCLYAPVGLLFHWQSPGYLVLFLAAGRRLHRLLAVGGRPAALSQRWWRFTLVASPLVMLGVWTHAVTGWGLLLMPTVVADQIGALDPTLESVDYDGLAEVLEKHGLLDGKTLVATPRWFISGKVDYALRGRAPVICLIESDPRVFAFFHDQREWLGGDVVLVSMRRYLDDPVSGYAGNFLRVEPIASIPVRRGGRTDRVLDVFIGRNFHTPLPQKYGINAAPK
jgi:hypothetical protein